MKCYWVVLSALFVAGCMVSNGLEYESVSTTNQYRLARVRKGMSELDVLYIMHKPYSYESFQVDEDIYDVWFYVTRVTGLDQTRMVPQNLTPLTFKNGVLVGTGYSWYYFAMKEEAQQIANEAGPIPPRVTQEMEDTEFENALRPYPAPTQSAPVNKPIQTSMAPPVCQDEDLSCLTTEIKDQDSIPEVQQTADCEKAPPKPEISTAAKPEKSWGPPAFIKPWKPNPLLGAKKVQLSKVQVGMTETEVTNLLGSPSRFETYKMNQDVYDVWFYNVTPSNKTPQSMPLTFKNSVLVGMTAEYYTSIKEAASQDRINGYDRSAEQMKEAESDQNFDYW